MSLARLLRQQQYQDHDARKVEPFRLTPVPQSTLRLDPVAVRKSIRGCVIVDGCIVKVIAR